MGANYEELKEFEKKLQNIANEKKLNDFFEKCVKELALKFLSEAIRLTPVADSKKYKRNKRLRDDDGNYIRERYKTRKYKRLRDDDGNYVKYKKGAKKGEVKLKAYTEYIEGKIKTKSYIAHTGGTLRRGWIVKTHSEAEGNKKRPSVTDINSFLENVKIIKQGNSYSLKLINPVKYAIYVNYGHRTRGGGFVDGRFFLEKAENYINVNKDKFLEKRLNEYIGSALNDK